MDESDVGKIYLGENRAYHGLSLTRIRKFWGKVTKNFPPLGTEKDKRHHVLRCGFSISNESGQNCERLMTANAEIILEEHKGVSNSPPEGAILYAKRQVNTGGKFPTSASEKRPQEKFAVTTGDQ